MQLRHHRGALNTVPYGMIRRLVNENRNWTIVKLEFRLSYGTDIGKVRKIFMQVGKELQEDSELVPGILEPLKFQGDIYTEAGKLVVQAKFKARPDDLQYIIRREAYAQILKAFKANGVGLAERQVTVSTHRPPAPEPRFASSGLSQPTATDSPQIRRLAELAPSIRLIRTMAHSSPG